MKTSVPSKGSFPLRSILRLRGGMNMQSNISPGCGVRLRFISEMVTAGDNQMKQNDDPVARY
jgi:hypothetical protein